jgi:hypothetical protein
MHFRNLVIGIGMAFGIATHASAGELTIDELHASAKVATDTFKAEYGQDLYTTIYAIQTMRRNDGGRIKLFYRNAANNQTIEYFCHYHHANQMDCHEL